MDPAIIKVDSRCPQCFEVIPIPSHCLPDRPFLAICPNMHCRWHGEAYGFLTMSNFPMTTLSGKV